MARFIRILKNGYEPLDHRQIVVSFDRMFSDFVSAETSTSGDAETSTFISDVEGLFVSLGHLDPYYISRIPHFHYVAARHELDFCAGLKIKYPSLIETLFPLQVSCSSCSYLGLGERSLEAILGECIVELVVGEI